MKAPFSNRLSNRIEQSFHCCQPWICFIC